MPIAAHLLATLEWGESLESPLPAPDEHTWVWVVVSRLFEPSNPDSPKFGKRIKPNAKYMVRWVQMTDQLYQAFIRGSNVRINSEADPLIVELADDVSELEQILSARLPDLSKLVPRSRNPIRYPP